MTSDRLAEIRELLANATPGPLSVDDENPKCIEDSDGEWLLYTEPTGFIDDHYALCRTEGDAALFAAAPTIIAELLAEVEEYHGVKEVWKEAGPAAMRMIRERDRLKAKLERIDLLDKELAEMTGHELLMFRASTEEEKQLGELEAENRRLREALEDAAAMGCSGLEMDGVSGSTCMTQDEWKEHPGKWCFACTAKAALASEEG